MNDAVPFGEPLELETADADDRSVEWFEGRHVAKAPISHGADTSTGIDHERNRLVTLYDREFDSLGNLEVSQWLYPETTNQLKDVDDR